MIQLNVSKNALKVFPSVKMSKCSKCSRVCRNDSVHCFLSQKALKVSKCVLMSKCFCSMFSKAKCLESVVVQQPLQPTPVQRVLKILQNFDQNVNRKVRGFTRFQPRNKKNTITGEVSDIARNNGKFSFLLVYLCI